MTAASQNPFNTQLLYLVSWPSPEHLLESTGPHTIRICALLARRPSAGMLIPVILDIPPHIARPLLEMLYADGYVRPAGAAAAPSTPAPKAAPAPSQEPTPDISFLAKLWQHLITKSRGGPAAGEAPAAHPDIPVRPIA